MSGYLSLGLVAFFLFLAIEFYQPGSLHGLPETVDEYHKEGSILYFAFITLMTVGYGEIVPAVPLAQKAAMLVGLAGQFYLVILTAVIVGKYLHQITTDQ
nr:ion channel [Ruegeria sp. Ofav3-42]